METKKYYQRVRRLYSQEIDWKYSTFNGNNIIYVNNLSSFLERFKLFTFQITKNIDYKKNVNSNIIPDSFSQIVDIIFVGEKHCIIIEQIEISLIFQIMQYLTEKEIVFLNFSPISSNYPNIPQIEDDIKDYFQPISTNFNKENYMNHV